VDRSAGLRGGPFEPGVDEGEPADRASLQLALGARAVPIELASRALADPAGDAEAAEIVDGSRKAAHKMAPPDISEPPTGPCLTLLALPACRPS
jgi:hypothetical protein